jgi:DNA ligase (NAD+)
MNTNEKLYLDAKKAYYDGNPLMTDTAFDRLEDLLRAEGSNVINIVGSDDTSKENQHLSPMLSLQKTQVNDLEDKSLPIQKFNDWIEKTSNLAGTLLQKTLQLEAEPKFDGSSCNLTYKNGKLISASTRGNGTHGTDITSKIMHIVPNEISIPGLIEMRGEVIIKTKLFNEKYSMDYKNPRNFVAGILGRDEIKDLSVINDFDFIAFEYRIHENNAYEHGTKQFEILKRNGFLIPDFVHTFFPSQFETIFNQFHYYRIHDCEYGLDGFVIKFPHELRNKIGETDHHPKWAMAIKFPPTEAVTYINRIEWNIGQSGEFKPVGLLEPIDLDGTTVSRVALHNLGNIQTKGLFPGAKVVIVKSGDIIPIVRHVITPVFAKDINDHIPTQCSTPECKIEIDGVHLLCTNPNCKEQLISRLSVGIGTFELDNVGGATIENLYNAGIRTMFDLFDKTKFNEANLIKSGYFKKGRALEIILQSFEKRKPITMPRIIASLAFKNVGFSTSEQIAKLFDGGTPDFSGKSREAYAPFYNQSSSEYQSVIRLIDLIKANGYIIETEVKAVINADSIKFEMTGSPKEYGFKTKEEFVKLIAPYGYVQTSLSADSTYLITDDVDSSTSKTAKAKKLGVKIVTYGDIVNLIKQ